MLILCGKTATGKSTIAKELQKLGMRKIVTYTTRPPRDGEINGIDYNFIEEEHFMKQLREGFFITTTSYQIDHETTWYYGTPLNVFFDSKNSVLILNPNEIKQIHNFYETESICIKNKISICQIKASKDMILKRLEKRGDKPEEIRRRMEEDDKDFANIEDMVNFSLQNNLTLMTIKDLAQLIMLKYYSYISEVSKNESNRNNDLNVFTNSKGVIDITTYKIYLSGGMAGLTKESQTKWRNKVKERLEGCDCRYHVKCINPVDYYSYDRPEDYDSDREVMEFELHMVRKSDLLIVNFNKPDSLGTMAEMAVAYEKRIPIIGINDGGYVLHPWQRDMCEKIFTYANAALNYIENYYLY